MELSPEQRHCLEIAKNENCFFTGEAGTGKSYLLRQIQRDANNRNGPENVYATAPTGRAAKNIGGTTVHAFAGIGLGDSTSYQMLKRVQSNKEALARWSSCKTLIIDEVSMLSLPLFEKLEFLGRMTRGNNTPFGNLQLLFFGDFFQLPPVPENGQQDVQYCFESPLWDIVIQKNVELTHVYRQTEPEYLSLLREVRKRSLSSFSHNMLDRLKRAIPGSDETLHLFTRRDDVSKKNYETLTKIPHEGVTFHAIDTGQKDYLKNCRVPKVLQLKQGARVLLLQNMPEFGLVNGERGKVISFVGKYPLVDFEEGQKVLIKERTFHQVK